MSRTGERPSGGAVVAGTVEQPARTGDGAAQPPEEPKRAGQWRRPLGVAARYALMLLVLVITVGPFLWQLSTSLKGPAENIFAFPPDLIPNDPTIGNYGEVADVVPVFRFIGNSFIVAIATTVTNCVIAAMAGYALARMQFRGRGLLFALFVSTLIIPFEVILISVYLVTRSLGLLDTLLGVIIPHAVTPLSVFIMRQGFLSLPQELEEAAHIDGANEWQTFLRVALPSVRGQLAVVGIFSFIFAWDDFLWPLIVLSDTTKYTLTVGLEYLSGTFSADQRLIAAGTIIAVVPLIALFVALQKQFFRGVGEGAVKG